MINSRDKMKKRRTNKVSYREATLLFFFVFFLSISLKCFICYVPNYLLMSLQMTILRFGMWMARGGVC